MRGSYKIQDERTRAETLGFAREEFKRNKGVEDLVCFDSTNGFQPSEIRADAGLIGTYSIPHINRKDAVGDNGEAY